MNPSNIIVLGKHGDLDKRSFLLTRGSSILGNPYITGKDGTREEVIAKYKVWLYKQIQLKNEVYDRLIFFVEKYLKGETIRIRCVCKPKACHIDVVKEAIIELASKHQVITIEEL